MVEDRITDGKRIAQLLSSEVTGLERGPLASASVTDADPDADPVPDGRRGFAIAVDGERVGEVWLYPEGAVLALDPGHEAVADAAADRGLGRTDPPADAAGTAAVRIESGAAVKRAVDALVAGLGD